MKKITGFVLETEPRTIRCPHLPQETKTKDRENKWEGNVGALKLKRQRTQRRKKRYKIRRKNETEIRVLPLGSRELGSVFIEIGTPPVPLVETEMIASQLKLEYAGISRALGLVQYCPIVDMRCG